MATFDVDSNEMSEWCLIQDYDPSDIFNAILTNKTDK